MEVEKTKNKIFNFRGFFVFEIHLFYEHKVLRFRWILVYLHCRVDCMVDLAKSRKYLQGAIPKSWKMREK